MTNEALVDFSDRLRKACANNPQLPRENEGLYSFIARELGVKPQAARRYFAAEAKPRPKKMEMLAKVVNADQAWLALGVGDKAVTHKMRTVSEKVGDNSAKLVCGFMGINGHNCIMSDGENGVDVICEKYGTQMKIAVTAGINKGDNERIVSVKPTFKQHLNLVVFQTGKLSIDILVIPPEIIEPISDAKSGRIEFPVEHRDGKYFVENAEIQRLQDTNFL